jgi:hypothetical protein
MTPKEEQNPPDDFFVDAKGNLINRLTTTNNFHQVLELQKDGTFALKLTLQFQDPAGNATGYDRITTKEVSLMYKSIFKNPFSNVSDPSHPSYINSEGLNRAMRNNLSRQLSQYPTVRVAGQIRYLNTQTRGLYLNSVLTGNGQKIRLIFTTDPINP